MLRIAAWSVILFFGTHGFVPAANWPEWRGADRNGIAEGESIRTDWSARPPELLWTADGMGQGYASVAIVDGVLYTTGNGRDGQQVVAADAATGEIVWTRTVTEGAPRHSYPGSRCTPTVDGDRLYVVTSDGSIVCLNRAGGDIVWRRNFVDEWDGKMMSHWGYSESPLVDGDAVICTPGGPDALLVKLNKLTGEEIWATPVSSSAFDGQGTSTAAYASVIISQAAGVKQYVQLTGGGLVGVRADDGQLLWTYSRIANRTANIPTPIAIGDFIFGATGYRAGAALLRLSPDGRGGVTAKEAYFLDGDQFQNHHGGMVRYGDYIYGGNGHKNGFPTCINWKTGEIVWGGKLRGAGSGSAAVTGVGQNLLFRYEDGTLAIIKATPEDYVLEGTLKPAYQEGKSWSHPVVVDGRLYLREQDKLMCYDVSR